MSEFELAEALDLPEDYNAVSVLENPYMATADELVAAHSELTEANDYNRYYLLLTSRVLDQTVTENLESRYRRALHADGHEQDPDDPLVFRGPNARAVRDLLGFQGPVITAADGTPVSSDYVLIEGSRIWEAMDDNVGRWGGRYGTSELADESIEAMGFVIDMLDEDFENDNINSDIYVDNLIRLLARHEMPDEQLRELVGHTYNLTPTALVDRLENTRYFHHHPDEDALSSRTDFARVAIAYLLTDSEREHEIELPATAELIQLAKWGQGNSSQDVWLEPVLSQIEDRVKTFREKLEGMDKPAFALTKGAKKRRDEYLKLQHTLEATERLLNEERKK
ncbi:hypothetical protein KA529_00315 [Candidatus Saccharibacteria bacterium]|nr:hypothetical protein [Candidatus Saccharibacteria bacterium]